MPSSGVCLTVCLSRPLDSVKTSDYILKLFHHTILLLYYDRDPLCGRQMRGV